MVSDVNITKWELRYAQDNNRYKMKNFGFRDKKDLETTCETYEKKFPVCLLKLKKTTWL